MVKVNISNLIEKIYVNAFPSTYLEFSDTRSQERYTEGFPVNIQYVRPIYGITPWISSAYVANGQLLLADFSDIAFDFKLGKELNELREPRKGYNYVDRLEIKVPDHIKIRNTRCDAKYKVGALLEVISHNNDPWHSYEEGFEVFGKMVTALFGAPDSESNIDGNNVRERMKKVIKPLSEEAGEYVRKDYENVLRRQLDVGRFPIVLKGKLYSFEIKNGSIIFE